jgi:hypothetical protein
VTTAIRPVWGGTSASVHRAVCGRACDTWLMLASCPLPPG